MQPLLLRNCFLCQNFQKSAFIWKYSATMQFRAKKCFHCWMQRNKFFFWQIIADNITTLFSWNHCIDMKGHDTWNHGWPRIPNTVPSLIWRTDQAIHGWNTYYAFHFHKWLEREHALKEVTDTAWKNMGQLSDLGEISRGLNGMMRLLHTWGSRKFRNIAGEHAYAAPPSLFNVSRIWGQHHPTL